MALTDLTSVKDMLGITTTSQDAQLAALIPSAEKIVKEYCHRDFEQATYTQYYCGNNTYRLALRQTPVTNVASVYLDNSGFFDQRANAFPATTLLTEGTHYVLDREVNATYSKSGILFKIGGTWPAMERFPVYSRLAPDLGPATGNIKVTYTAGYAVIPADIQYAVAVLTRWMQRAIAYGGTPLLKEKLGDYAYETARRRLDTDFELGTLKATLAPYREFGW